MTKHLRDCRKRLVSFLAILSLLVFSASAFASAKVKIKVPEYISANALTISVHKTFPTNSSITESVTEAGGSWFSAANTVTKEPDDSWIFDRAGTYCYYVRGTHYYSLVKLFNVTEAQVNENKTIELTAATGPIGAHGYEPGNPYLADAPSNYASELLDLRDKILAAWPDELMNAIYSTNGLQGYKDFTTPTFTKQKARHEFTSQEDMMEFVQNIVNSSQKAHLFELGKTPNYSMVMPLVIVTNSPIPAGATLADAAKILRESGKPTFWHQAQIHSNEPASGEGALAMLQEMVGSYGEPLLNNVNYVCVPRINPDGSYLFTRVTHGGFDMNRDHMRLQAKELDYLHGAFTLIMPEVCADGHEFTFWSANANGYVANADDVESTPASSLNNPREVNDFAMNEMAVKLHQDLGGSGLRNYHYGYTVNNPIGRAYYGLFGSISFLVETRGIGAGKHNFPRRVFAQVTAMKSLVEQTAHNASHIREMVANARKEIISKGGSYDEEDKLILRHRSGGETAYALRRPAYNMDGTLRTNPDPVKDTMNYGARQPGDERTRPTAYIVAKDARSDNFNLELALYIVKAQGAEFYEIASGSTAGVRQYYWTSNVGSNSVTANLRAETSVTFANGAYVFPLDQVAGPVLSMLFEPDVYDSNGYNGTLVQSGIVKRDGVDADHNYPIYRFEKSNPREHLRDINTQNTGGGDSGGGCDAGFSIYALVTVAFLAGLFRKRARK